MRLHSVLQLVALIDLDLDSPRRHVPEELVGKGAFLGRVGDVVGKGRACDEQRSLDRELHCIDRWDRARCGTDAYEQATALERVERALEGILANAVVHDRYAGPVGQFADALGNVLATVEDHVIAAVRSRDLGLLFRRYRTDDRKAEKPGPLRDDQTYAAGSRVQQNRVAGLQRPDATQKVSRSESAHSHRRRGL